MAQLPLFYRAILLWIEPLFAIGGVFQAIFDPEGLLKLSLPGVRYTDDMYPLLLGTAGSWLLLVYQKVVTLRKCPDRKTWNDIMLSHALADVFYLSGYVYDIGLVRFLSPWKWTQGDWITNPSTTIPLLAKILYLYGVGL